MTTTQTRDKLKTIKQQLAEARDRRRDVKHDVDAARDKFVTTDLPTGKRLTESSEFKDAERATRNLAAIEDEIAGLQSQENAILQLLGGGDGGSTGAGLGFASPVQFGEATREYLMAHAPRNVRLPTVDRHGDDWRGGESLGQFMNAEQTAARFGSRLIDTPFDVTSPSASFDDTGAPSLTEGTRESRIERALRLAPRLTQFFAAIPKDEGDSYKYVAEIGTWDTARETVPGAVKSEADVEYVDRETVYARIAHWIKVHKDKLADAADLSNALREGLVAGGERRLEGQIVAGDGAGANLSGVFDNTGIGDIEFVSGESAADQILRGIATVIQSGGMPNVTAMSVTDWINLVLAKEEGTGAYIGSGPFGAAPAQLWWTTPVPVPLMTPGDVLVADTTGGRVLVRESWSVVFGQESDDLIRNMATALGEARFGFEVRQPAKFCRVNLTA